MPLCNCLPSPPAVAKTSTLYMAKEADTTSSIPFAVSLQPHPSNAHTMTTPHNDTHRCFLDASKSRVFDWSRPPPPEATPPAQCPNPSPWRARNPDGDWVSPKTMHLAAYAHGRTCTRVFTCARFGRGHAGPARPRRLQGRNNAVAPRAPPPAVCSQPRVPGTTAAPERCTGLAGMARGAMHASAPRRVVAAAAAGVAAARPLPPAVSNMDGAKGLLKPIQSATPRLLPYVRETYIQLDLRTPSHMSLPLRSNCTECVAGRTATGKATRSKSCGDVTNLCPRAAPPHTSPTLSCCYPQRCTFQHDALFVSCPATCLNTRLAATPLQLEAELEPAARLQSLRVAKHPRTYTRTLFVTHTQPILSLTNADLSSAARNIDKARAAASTIHNPHLTSGPLCARHRRPSNSGCRQNIVLKILVHIGSPVSPKSSA